MLFAEIAIVGEKKGEIPHQKILKLTLFAQCQSADHRIQTRGKINL